MKRREGTSGIMLSIHGQEGKVVLHQVQDSFLVSGEVGSFQPCSGRAGICWQGEQGQLVLC